MMMTPPQSDEFNLPAIFFLVKHCYEVIFIYIEIRLNKEIEAIAGAAFKCHISLGEIPRFMHPNGLSFGDNLFNNF